MLDQVGINSLVFWKLSRKQEKTIHTKFLNELGLQLAQPCMKRRFNKNLPTELRTYIEDISFERSLLHQNHLRKCLKLVGVTCVPDHYTVSPKQDAPSVLRQYVQLIELKSAKTE